MQPNLRCPIELKSKPDLKVSIEGHTDNQGNAAANKILSLDRAKNRRVELVRK